jgi:hypothetical protein
MPAEIITVKNSYSYTNAWYYSYLTKKNIYYSAPASIARTGSNPRRFPQLS